jgi:hypothetical protein
MLIHHLEEEEEEQEEEEAEAAKREEVEAEEEKLQLYSMIPFAFSYSILPTQHETPHILLSLPLSLGTKPFTYHGKSYH